MSFFIHFFLMLTETTTTTTLESLSNELFLDLFEYFNVINLLPSFADLNTRFDSLLFDHCRTFRLDPRSVSEEDFDDFHEMYFPLVTAQIFYFRLSDDDKTPYQCAQFWCSNARLGVLTNLRFLTFHKLRSQPFINQHFFVELHQLRHLTRLKFVDCSFLELT